MQSFATVSSANSLAKRVGGKALRKRSKRNNPFAQAFASRRNKVRPSLSTLNSAVSGLGLAAAASKGRERERAEAEDDSDNGDDDYAWYETDKGETQLGIEFTQSTTMNGLNHTTVGPLGCR